MGRDDADEAKNTHVVTQPGAVGVGTESSVREADGLFTVECEDQARRVEIRLGEDEVLQRRAVPEMDGPALRECGVPDLRQPRRIVVAKRAILDHERPLPTAGSAWREGDSAASDAA